MDASQALAIGWVSGWIIGAIIVLIISFTTATPVTSSSEVRSVLGATSSEWAFRTSRRRRLA